MSRALVNQLTMRGVYVCGLREAVGLRAGLIITDLNFAVR